MNNSIGLIILSVGIVIASILNSPLVERYSIFATSALVKFDRISGKVWLWNDREWIPLTNSIQKCQGTFDPDAFLRDNP